MPTVITLLSRAGRKIRSCVWLALAGGLWAFAGGRWVISAAAWLAPVFMVRWFRSHHPAVAFPLAAAVAGAAYFVAWRGVASVILPPALYVVFCLAAAALYLLPYLADRLWAPRQDGLAATLVFPAAVVAFEYVMSLVSPLGTWNALAYTQIHNLPLVQLAAVTGIWGISFVVAWLAGVANTAWDAGFVWLKIRRYVLAFAVVLTAVIIAGGARLAIFTPAAPTVRVAGVIARPFLLTRHPELGERLIAGGRFTAGDRKTVKVDAAAINDDLFARTEREARAGARVVVWGEVSAMTLAEDEAALVARGRELAGREKIYLGMAVGTLTERRPKPFENKFIFIDPEGRVGWEYLKSIPVPGPEDAITRRGDGRVPILATPHGRLAGAICYDMDFPPLIRPAGVDRADIMLVPSHDWKELGALHAELAVFRAVENGFSLFRPDNDGVSLAADYLGRPLATMDYFTTADATFVAHLPTRGVYTLYSRFGDWFAWLCLGGLIVLFAYMLLGKRKTKYDGSCGAQ